jgi:hypothetical protein
MNIKTKLAYLAFALSLTTTASFGQTSLSDLSQAFLDTGKNMQTIRTDISATDPAAYDPTNITFTKPTGDLAVIDQGVSGTTPAGTNDAYISQTFGTIGGADINIASISQLGDANKAYIEQEGGGNVALINQLGDTNLAYISQTGATNSIAGINQTAAAGNSAGYITQSGTSHSALIIQQ